MRTATLPTPASSPQSRALTPEDTVDSLAAIEPTYRRPDAAGVCVVDGFGCRLVVERGPLEVHDGIGPTDVLVATTERSTAFVVSSS
jgi:hypothetical protein